MATNSTSEYDSLISILLNSKSPEESDNILYNNLKLIDQILYYKLKENEIADKGEFILNYIIEYLAIKLLEKPSGKDEFLKLYLIYLLSPHSLVFLKNLAFHYRHINDKMNYDYIVVHYRRLVSDQINEKIGEVDYKNITIEGLNKLLFNIEELASVVDESIAPFGWGQLCGEKGNTLFHLEKYESSIEQYQNASKVLTKKVDFKLWASTQRSIGNSYVKLKDISENNITEAIKYFNISLEYFTRDDFPKDWADLHRKIGNSYLFYDYNKENISKALAHYNLALQIFTRNSFPENWASLQL